MKRNLDLIKHILLVREESNNEVLENEDFVTDNFDYEAVSYHIALLIDEDYIKTQPIPTLSSASCQYLVFRLTSKGHDFLDSIRDENIFNKAKSKLADIGGNTTLDIVKSVATGLIMSALKI